MCVAGAAENQDAGVDPDEFLAMLTDGRIADPQADTWMLC